MSITDIIKEQIESARSWTEHLVLGIDRELWFVTPETIRTNINWQVGHILLSKYFHGIACITGTQPELTDDFPISRYDELYERETQPGRHIEIKPGKERLLADLKIIDDLTLKELAALKVSDLQEKTLLANPVAKTKYEALMWCFNHQMWHNGQIAILKRILSE